MVAHLGLALARAVGPLGRPGEPVALLSTVIHTPKQPAPGKIAKFEPAVFYVKLALNGLGT